MIKLGRQTVQGCHETGLVYQYSFARMLCFNAVLYVSSLMDIYEFPETQTK